MNPARSAPGADTPRPARSAPGADWLGAQREELAADRILDITEELFAEHGIGAVTMRQVAAAAGCSRATLYRYFPGREALHLAYVDRAARRIARQVSTATARTDERLLTAVTAALAGVRADPALLAWFAPGTAGAATELALLSPVVEHVVVEHLRGTPAAPADDITHRRAEWLVRVIVSLLTSPGESAAAEEQMLRTFLLPVMD